MKREIIVEIEQNPGQQALYRIKGAKEIPLSELHSIFASLSTDIMIKMTANTVIGLLQAQMNQQRVQLFDKLP